MAKDTIFALSTAPGRSAIAVFRLSGQDSLNALKKMVKISPPEPRRASTRRLFDPRSGALIDHGLVLWLPGPETFSGEDMVELHVHGGPAVLAAISDALAAVPGLRPAEAGEFTRRAFDNGRLDLTAVEALADLIAAETEAQRRQALRQMEGGLGDLCESWRGRLIRALALVEADIDFADEDDVDTDTASRAMAEIPALIGAMRAQLTDDRRGERLRDGFQVAIVGAPNVGKSSLLNQIAGRDVAIVTEMAGTTRDVIEVHLDLGGYPVTLADTAGLRDSADLIEREGVRRAERQAAAADLVLIVGDAAGGTIAQPTLSPGQPRLCVWNKIDLVDAAPARSAAGDILVSARSGRGLDRLLDAISAQAREAMSSGDAPALTRIRHRRALEETVAALEQARTASELALAAEDLRIAARALGRITGRVDVEDVLAALFAEFCIGK